MADSTRFGEFDKTVAEVRAEVAVLSERQLRFSPAGEEWSVATIAGHLATAMTFSRELYAIASSGGSLDMAIFAPLRGRLEAAKAAPLDQLLTDFDADVSRYRGMLAELSDESFATTYSLTMPSGTVREISGAVSIENAINHLREHQQQIRDWAEKSET